MATRSRPCTQAPDPTLAPVLHTIFMNDHRHFTHNPLLNCEHGVRVVMVQFFIFKVLGTECKHCLVVAPVVWTTHRIMLVFGHQVWTWPYFRGICSQPADQQGKQQILALVPPDFQNTCCEQFFKVIVINYLLLKLLPIAIKFFPNNFRTNLLHFFNNISGKMQLTSFEKSLPSTRRVWKIWPTTLWETEKGNSSFIFS